jgi:hydroxymethylbilane synthase
LSKKLVYKIGTRGSMLALWQAEHVKASLEKLNPDISFELEIIKTSGDRFTDVHLSQIGGKGLFIKELEDALFGKKIDLAVHSLKDMTTIIPEGLSLSCTLKREDVRDCLITSNKKSIYEMEPGTIIGTSSLRRQAQILNLRPDLEIKMLRGNLDTRIKKLESGEFGAIILAACGLKRLGYLSKVDHYLDPEIFIPAVGQGVIAIESRSDDESMLSILKKLDDKETHECITAERAFLRKLEGSCKAPIAAHAIIKSSQILLVGMVASLDGKKLIKDEILGKIEDAEDIGYNLGELLLAKGADKILKEIIGS